MIRIISQTWFTAALGAVIFLVATVLFWQKPVLPQKQDITETVPNIGPSWEFNNPEADQLISELKAEKNTMEQREQQLNDLERRLNSERGELAQVIQTVRQLQADFDKSVLRVKEDETANLKKLAKVYASMTPDTAASVLEQLDNEAIIKILLFLKDGDTAAILEALAKKSDAAARRTAEISEKIRLSSKAKPTK